MKHRLTVLARTDLPLLNTSSPTALACKPKNTRVARMMDSALSGHQNAHPRCLVRVPITEEQPCREILLQSERIGSGFYLESGYFMVRESALRRGEKLRKGQSCPIR